MIEPVCFRCHKPAADLEEYQGLARENGYESPAAAVWAEEGTFNPETNTFACTDCYIAIGMPSRPYPDSWKAPASEETELPVRIGVGWLLDGSPENDPVRAEAAARYNVLESLFRGALIAIPPSELPILRKMIDDELEKLSREAAS